MLLEIKFQLLKILFYSTKILNQSMKTLQSSIFTINLTSSLIFFGTNINILIILIIITMNTQNIEIQKNSFFKEYLINCACFSMI